jgi:ribosomal protein S18 acetylase RimI-like enzyme
MIRIEPITLENAELFRRIRLRALQESPTAFCSTYAQESAFDAAEWASRVGRFSGEQGIGFLAIDDPEVCGMAGALIEACSQAQLVSMWTAPEYRRQGVGRLLVEAVIAWAVNRGLQLLRLMVTSCNEPAMSFYDSLGFTRTGRIEPYPNDPALIEWEMARRLD